jgi:hypothetical protein
MESLQLNLELVHAMPRGAARVKPQFVDYGKTPSDQPPHDVVNRGAAVVVIDNAVARLKHKAQGNRLFHDAPPRFFIAAVQRTVKQNPVGALVADASARGSRDERHSP